MKAKTPMRRCNGCFKSKPKNELIRVVRLPHTKQIVIDESGKMDGRGSYVCKNEKCLHVTKKARKLDRSMKCKIDDDIYEKLSLYE